MLTVVLLSVGFAVTTCILTMLCNAQERFNSQPFKVSEVIEITLFLVIPAAACGIGLMYFTGLWALLIGTGSFMVGMLAIEGVKYLYKHI